MTESTQPVKGLTLDVFRPADGHDSTNGGLSSRVNRVTVVGILDQVAEQGKPVLAELPHYCRVFTPTEDAPAVLLQKRWVGEVVWSIVPAPDGTQPLKTYAYGWMFGSNFAFTHDSRLREVTGLWGPVGIHDRREW